MGFLSSIFSGDNEEKLARKLFAKAEKAAMKWPSMEYDQALGVYMNGSIVREYAEKGKLRYKISVLPDLVDREKALALCRAARDPENVRKMQRRFGKKWSDPSAWINLYMVALLPEGEELNNHIKEFWDKKYYVAYYIYRKGLMDICCKTLEDRLTLYDLISRNPEANGEKDSNYSAGTNRFVIEEILGGVSCEERRRQGIQEIAKLLNDPDSKVRNRTQNFLNRKKNEENKKRKEKMKEYLGIYQFMQDELEVQLVDKDNREVRLNDGKIKYKK